jgi:hypothetical protein
MAEDPIRSNALIPASLCMRVCACFYCGSSTNYQDVNIEYLYGIRTCPDHKAWAERDCRAHCHRLKTVPLAWIADSPKLAPILEQFKNRTISVRRSSGDLDSGWTLGSTSRYESDYIQKCKDVWALPLVNIDKEVQKKVSIQDILRENPELNATVFEEAIVALEDGIYKAEFDAHTLAAGSGNTTELPEEPCVGMVWYQDRFVRATVCP